MGRFGLRKAKLLQLRCSACAMTFVLVSVLYKHVCECIDDPFATPVTDATLVSEVG